MPVDRISDELHAILGDEAFLALVENFGGDRLYVPKGADNRVSQAIGSAAASKLAAHFGGDSPRIPLAREFRARQYRLAGMTNPAIAKRLGMTVPGVEQLFARAPTPRIKKVDERQLTMFD